jgi:hypothetical protein
MTTATRAVNETRTGETVERDTGLTGRVIVTWTVGGGLAVGGFLVAAMTLAGQLSGAALLMTAGGLYIIGALLGWAHGAALGFLGRPADMTAREALGKLGMGTVYALPAMTVGFLAAGWIAMTTVALYLGKPLPMIGVAAGWLVGVAVLLGAMVNGAVALENAYARWADRRIGTVLVAGTFAALLMLFLADRPELWGLRLRVTEVGAVLLAAIAALWIAGPVVTAGLALVRRLPAWPEAGFDRAPRALTNIAIGLAAGAVLGVLAVPFQQAAFAVTPAVGTVGGVVLLLSRALVDEVLLRLFLVTGVVWMLTRHYNTPVTRAAVYAVVAAAVIQVALYVPGVAAVGFPTAGAAAVYLAMTALVPALVFGVLYWKRGFATALLADAAALLAIAFII